MDRRNFYFKQPVSESELDGAFDAAENALFRLMTDMKIVGVLTQLVGAQVSPTPNLNVTVSGPGVAYDAAGQRISVAASSETVDVSHDSNLVPTTVAGSGNEKWVSVFIKFDRALSDPRVDGNSASVFFVANESHQYEIVQGAEASVGTAPKPALDPAAILLFDVHRTFGQTQIFNADINTARRQDAFVISQSPISTRAGTVYDALAAQLQALNNHVTGVSGVHPDTAISAAAHAGTRFSLSSGTVDSQLSAIQAEIDTVLVNGADTLRTFASVAALRAIAVGTIVANSVASVLGKGIFTWDAASAIADDGNFFINPTGNGGAGRWRRGPHGLWGDVQIHEELGTYDTTFFATTSNSFQVAMTETLSLAKPGDIVVAHASYRPLVDPGVVGEYELTFQEDSGSTTVVNSSLRRSSVSTGDAITVCVSGKYTVAGSPTAMKVMLSARNSGLGSAGNAYVLVPSQILAFLVKQ